jgi:hypothetical protein
LGKNLENGKTEKGKGKQMCWLNEIQWHWSNNINNQGYQLGWNWP